ncbi:hypothetical protein Q1I10_000244 [Enterococcus faecium]|nr:hypothetical protein [Enterococcus faecium]EME3552934.1 hypothetical protein [Enterococcus faecium]
MHKKKENLFPAFFATLFASGFAFFTSYGLGTLNPAVIIGLAMVLLLAFKQYGIELFSIKNKVAAIARLFFSAAFALTLSIGRQIQFQYVSANYTKTTIADGSIFYFLVFFSVFVYSFLFLQSIYLSMPKLETFFTAQNTQAFSSRKYFLFFTIFLVLCWLPYLLALYPGVVLPDSLSSVAQSMGDVPISNHHPVLFTLLVKLFVHDLPTDTINHGVFLFSIFQTLITASAISYSLCWLLKRHIHFFPVLISLCYFAFAPVFPIYALNMQKDTLFSIACFLFSLAVFDFIFQREKPTIPNQIYVIILALLTTYLRNNGIYVVIGTGLICGLIILKQKRYQAFFQVVLGYTVIAGLLIHPLMARYAIPTETAEQLGIPLQQISRTIVMDGDLSKKDKAFMNQLLPIKDYEAYSPSLADSIKWHKNFNNEFLNTHKKEFLSLWARNLPSNIKIYTDAYILETFGFWVPGTKNSYGFLDTRVNTNNYGIKQVDLIEHLTGLSGMKKIIDARDFFGSGTLLWLAIGSALLAIFKKKYRYLLLFLPGMLVFATIMIATPVAFSLRYVFVLALGLPVYILSPFLLDKREKMKTDIGDTHETI